MLESFFSVKFSYQANNYLYKLLHTNTRKRFEICSKLTITKPEWLRWRRSGVFIVKFKTFLSSVPLVDIEHLIASWLKRSRFFSEQLFCRNPGKEHFETYRFHSNTRSKFFINFFQFLCKKISVFSQLNWFNWRSQNLKKKEISGSL